MVGPRPVRARRPAVRRSSAVTVSRIHRASLPPLVHPPVGFISAGLPKRKWDGFFPVVSSEVATRNRKSRKVIHDRLRGRIPDAPFTSPLEPSWVGFSVEETDILKAGYADRSFYGGPAYLCGRCKASFWYQERVESASAITKRRVVYNNCCKAGKMAYSLLSEIHKDSHHWTICVLVSLMWHYRGGTDVGPIKHTDLVLIDEKGNHMYGQVPPATAERLKDVLQEGKVYVIRKFFCNPSKTTFRPVESPFMVQFTKFTIVEEKPGLEDKYPFCTYSLTAFADIPDPSEPRTRFIDVIGKISHVSDVVPVQAMYQDTASNTRTIVLTDLLGAEMRIVLWGDRAVEFDADAVRAMGDKEPVIAIFVGTLSKTLRGVKGLSGGSACRWYIDEDIPDMDSFRAGLGGQFVPLTAYVPTGPDALPARVYADPIEMNMKELSDVDPFENLEKRFICIVTVDAITTNHRWWFASCSICRKSAKHDGHQFQCSGENCDSVKADLAYCVSVFASDNTGGAEFVMFDRVGVAAVGKHLMTLMRRRYPGLSTVDEIVAVAKHDSFIPEEIQRLVGRKYKLLVSISKKWERNSESEDLAFQVSRIMETCKPELPPLGFRAGLESGGASSSTSGSATKIPPLGTIMSPMQYTPPGHGQGRNQPSGTGYGSPVVQARALPAASLSPATPAKGSSAPMRGARRSLFTSPSNSKEQLTMEEVVPVDEQTAASTEAGVDDDAAAVAGKEDGVLLAKTKAVPVAEEPTPSMDVAVKEANAILPKNKRNGTSGKPGGTIKKSKV